MKRAISILAILMILVNLLPEKANAAAPLIRIVGGSTAEKIMYGIAEKGGIKYANKTARQRALERWNYTIDDLYNWQNAEYKKRFDDFLKVANDVNKIEPIPNKPGFGRIVLSGAMFMTGLDLIFEGYQAFKDAQEKNGFVEGLSDAMKTGNYYTSLGSYRITTLPSEYSPGISHIMIVSQELNRKAGPLQYGWGMPDGSPYTAYFKITHNYATYVVVDAYARSVFAEDGKVYNNSSTHNLYKDINGTFGAGANTSYFKPNSNQVPDISGMVSSLVPLISSPLSSPVPLPESFPDNVEIIVPVNEPYPDPGTEPINDPIDLTDPSPNPNPDPPSLPGTEPIEQESPPEDTKPPSEDGCERPWDFKNFKSLGRSLSTHFPFSIPWDVYRAFYAIFGKMEESNGEWKFVLGASTDKPAEIEIKMPSFFDGWQKFIKTVLLITFDIGLIYAIRKWLGGAS